ncbi:Lysosomal acid phosphatase [Trichinella patagoniensis]|uniref:acid phosphatase n=1 Tax=Trichinella patagoniensis TaxID=990121 RepID=A0A0V1A5Y1_9BILA|nr:Lysosomal acid phosphatase [Trichinella patagoniensis]
MTTLENKLHLALSTIGLLIMLFHESSGERQLIFVHVMWRHGARAPLTLFPSEYDHTIQNWPNGLGELTPLGILQQFQLGTFLRQRYEKLIPKYKSDTIYIRSTDSNRTIMSAMANLAGMFPPENSQNILNLTWQPIPIHTIPKTLDKVLDVTYSTCPYPDHVFYSEEMNSETVRAIMEEKAALFDFLRERTGLEIPTFTDIFDVYDLLNCEKAHNMVETNRTWMNEALFKEIEDLFFKSTLHYYSNSKITPFRGGPLLQSVAEVLMKKAKKIYNDQLKYMAYSAHETGIIAFFTSMQIYNTSLIPDFAACIMTELYEEEDGTYTVDILYKRSLKEEVQILELPWCGTVCNLETFINWSNNIAVKDWEKECGLRREENFSELQQRRAVIFLSVALIVVITGLCILSVMYYQLKKLIKLKIPD